MAEKSRIAVFSSRIGLVAVLLCVLGAAAARWGLLPPYTGFRLFGLGLVPGALMSLVAGVIGLVRTRRATGLGGRGSAMIAVVIGAGLLGTLAMLVAPHASAPPIHDITTDPADAPEFREIAHLPENAARDLTYPHGGAGVIEQQREAYPDLESIRLALSAGAAFDAVQEAIGELGWTIVWSNRNLGVVEAFETSSIFRFVDDVVIRIREDESGSVVDVRSTSRDGVSDLGANARRIRLLAARLGPLHSSGPARARQPKVLSR